jgi:hypothetical protein
VLAKVVVMFLLTLIFAHLHGQPQSALYPKDLLTDTTRGKGTTSDSLFYKASALAQKVDSVTAGTKIDNFNSRIQNTSNSVNPQNKLNQIQDKISHVSASLNPQKKRTDVAQQNSVFANTANLTRGFAVIEVGIQGAGNNTLNEWENAHGIANDGAFNYAFKVSLLPKIKDAVSVGFDVEVNWSKRPDLININTAVIAGHRVRFNSFDLFPLVGLGMGSSSIYLRDTVPPPLPQPKAANATLLQFQFYLSPRLVLMKRIQNSGRVVGFDIGCNLYALQGAWRYIGGGINESEPSIPKQSIAHPYFSILFGLGR